MEFWGIEVIPGKPSDVKLEEHSYLHVSQAALGERKGGKGSAERVVIRAYVEKQEVVIGSLTPGKCDQISLDLIFNKGFKLSHNSTSYNVYFCGYTSESPGEEFFSSDEEEEDVKDKEPSGEAILRKANGKPVKDSKVNKTMSTVAAAAQGPKKVGFKDSVVGNPLKEETKKNNVKTQDVKGDKKKPIIVSDESDGENESDDEEEDDESDEDMEDVDDKLELLADSDSEDDDKDEEDIPKLKKRAKSSTGAIKTPQSGKKQKLLTLEGIKPGVISVPGKKIGDQKTATTPSAKQQQTPAQSAKKAPGKLSPSSNINKTSQEKSSPGAKQSLSKPGQYKCATCSRDFLTESALSQHASAKHKTG
ncbi:hypothetical protein O6H91_22G020000 [Diphasiastrum complanatum]|uniref:Uncharacterized protein n=1 Tax=Diphasiastrum complanatum TaxID=34168 RepID=A0ACC2ADH0_DIPCM|nr:hypothetical protein O6H91_22G020000 [Diphasiastrum complanatum]